MDTMIVNNFNIEFSTIVVRPQVGGLLDLARTPATLATRFCLKKSGKFLAENFVNKICPINAASPPPSQAKSDR
jgi:hypothetical protein